MTGVPWYLNHARHGSQPWDVQVEALRRAAGKDKYAYFLEQGLGKTALILNDFLHHPQVDLLLVVAPQSFKLDWIIEAKAWGIDGPEFKDWQFGCWPRDPLPTADGPPAIYSINYEAVSRSKAKQPLLDLLEQRPTMLCIDESAAIKNPQSGFAKSVLQLARRATMVREANGTPIVQNVVDYYAQLRALGEFNGWTAAGFRGRYARMGGYMGKVVQRGEIRNKDELFAVLDRCSFRALKKDWRDLPAQIDIPVHLEMSGRQLRHYREMMEDFFTRVNQVDVSADLILTQMLRLAQLSSCLAAADAEHYEFIVDPSDNPKLRAVRDILDSEPGKAVVVYVFKPSGELLIDQLDKAGYNPAVIRGGMRSDELITEKRRFNDDPDCRVLIGQESATFRGHTLLGGEGVDRCSRMVFYEASFSYYEYAQIRDRNHRGEQDQDCRYYQLITSPADQYKFDTLMDKRDMADSVDAVVAAIRSGAWTV